MNLETLSIEQLAELRDKVIATLSDRVPRQRAPERIAERDRPPRRCRIVRTPKTIHSSS